MEAYHTVKRMLSITANGTHAFGPDSGNRTVVAQSIHKTNTTFRDPKYSQQPSWSSASAKR